MRKSVKRVAICWMIFCFSLTTISVAVRAQEPKIAVGPNVHVSKDRANMSHAEVLMAADPKNPDWLIGCSMILPDPLKRHFDDGITYISHDGGLHWTPTLYSDKGETGDGDPACAFGNNGQAFSVYLEPSSTRDKNDVLVFRSSDGGKTWAEPAHLDWVDREYIAIDTTGGKYNGTIYVNGTGSVQMMDRPYDVDPNNLEIGISIQRSTDGGVTFRPPIKRLSTSSHWVLGMGNGVILSDGTYLAVYGEQQDRTQIIGRPPFSKANSLLKTLRTTDGGESFSAATVISDFYMNYGDISFTSSIVPVTAVDKTSGVFKDRIYTVWPDYRSGRGQILLSYSSDKGKTWSRPITVNDDRPWPAPAVGPDDGLPVVDVNNNGVVGVMWYDRRDSPNNFGWNIRFAASTDGGQTFGKSVRVSEAPATVKLGGQFDLSGRSFGGGNPNRLFNGGDLQTTVSLGDGFTYNGGHTAGMAADASGRFHPFWIDNRTGIGQVWTAAVSVEGSAIRYGSADMEGLQDVTGKMTLDLKNCTFDRATGAIAFDAYLGNTSKEAIKGPIKLRVLELDSRMGNPSIENSDNHLSGTGAVWDFTSALSDRSAGLAPGQDTGPKRMTFHLSNTVFGATPPTPDQLRTFVSFRSQILAGGTAEKN